MASQDFANANAVLNNEITLTRNFFAMIGKTMTDFLNRLAMASTGQRRFEMVQALRAKTDIELAAMGIKRDDIVDHVFGDLYNL